MAFNSNLKMALRVFRFFCFGTDQRDSVAMQCVNCRMPVIREIEHHRNPIAEHSFTYQVHMLA
jgi:hypothetical protein